MNHLGIPPEPGWVCLSGPFCRSSNRGRQLMLVLQPDHDTAVSRRPCRVSFAEAKSVASPAMEYIEH